MMTDAIRFSNRLHLIRELLEVYEIDIEDYVKEELWELYKFYKLERKRVAVSFIFNINIGLAVCSNIQTCAIYI